MIRKLAMAAFLAAFVAVLGVTGCDTKADKGATQSSNPQKPTGDPETSKLPQPPPPGPLLPPPK